MHVSDRTKKMHEIQERIEEVEIHLDRIKAQFACRVKKLSESLDCPKQNGCVAGGISSVSCSESFGATVSMAKGTAAPLQLKVCTLGGSSVEATWSPTELLGAIMEVVIKELGFPFDGWGEYQILWNQTPLQPACQLHEYPGLLKEAYAILTVVRLAGPEIRVVYVVPGTTETRALQLRAPTGSVIKRKLAAEAGVDISRCRVLFKGTELDSQPVELLGVTSGCTVHCVDSPEVPILRQVRPTARGDPPGLPPPPKKPPRSPPPCKLRRWRRGVRRGPYNLTPRVLAAFRGSG